MENNISSYKNEDAISGLPKSAGDVSDAQFEKNMLEKLEHHIKENINVFIWLRNK